MTESAPAPTKAVSSTRAWISAIRPKTLPVGAAPILVGSGFAWRAGVFDLVPAIAALLGALFIQIGTNLANDYYDHKRGADTSERKGPARASASGWIRPNTVLAASIGSFIAASAVGVYLISVAGWPILVIGLLSLASGYAYTGGPYPLGYHGWGDLFVFVFFGIVATAGTYYVQDSGFNHGVILAGAAMGALATAVLVVNNLRDIDTDRAAGKRTLAVKLGARGTQVEYVLLLVFAYAIPVIPVVQFRLPIVFALPVLTLPLAFFLAHHVWHHPDPETLNRMLAGTGMLTFLYGALFAIGAAVS
jgi:1,4-dihydroxy-2-naphthoate polyprenyltransferase